MTDYPSDEELARIESWPLGPFRELVEFAESLWAYPDSFAIEHKALSMFGDRIIRVDFSTGGWSGNESVVDSLGQAMGAIFWMCAWFSSRRGGHYVLEITPALWEGSS